MQLREPSVNHFNFNIRPAVVVIDKSNYRIDLGLIVNDVIPLDEEAIITGLAHQVIDVIVLSTKKAVSSESAIEKIIVGSAAENVVAVITKHAVGSAFTVKDVITVISYDRVVPRTPIGDVIPSISSDTVPST